jgi:Domain of unknown function (DUF4252)
MKKYIASFMLALLTAYPLAGFGQSSVEKDPAYLPIDKVLDLKTIRPEVNINLPRFLLKDALTELNGAGTNSALDGIDIADLIKDVKLIRVVVIEANQTNRPALDKAVKALRDELEKKWTAIVSVPEDNVGVYAMSDPAGESTTGLAVLVYDGGDAVIANVVGHVSIGKLIKLASQSDKVPKDFLKKLQGVANQTKEAKSGDGSSANAAGAGPKKPAEDSAPK